MKSLVLVAALAGCHGTPSAVAPAGVLGALDFPVTGSPACNRAFASGMLQLHSFLYAEAHATFEGSRKGCTMAAWGDAMAYDHAVWEEQDAVAARAALATITPAELAAASPKERAYIAAAHALYAEGVDQAAGRRAWLAAAGAMHAQFPTDDEVTLHYVLALIAAFGYDPAHVREQMEAGALALDVFARRPLHPGAAHFVIHAFDSRDHAILALPAARAYAKLAPAAGHAQHMPSHTFAHLGMWHDVVPSNERAIAAKPGDWHSYSWLVAALLELGQYKRAAATIADARAKVVAKGGREDDSQWRYDYANMIAMYATQTKRWSEVPALVEPLLRPAFKEGSDAPPQMPGGGGMIACGMHAPGGSGDMRMPTALFARMMAQRVIAEAAIAAGDPAGVAAAVRAIDLIRETLAPWRTVISDRDRAAWDATLADLGARSTGNLARIEPALRAAIAREDAAQSVGPGWLPTARELLADALLATRPHDALALYQADLVARPNRAYALLGIVRAGTAAGDTAAVAAARATLADVWRDADADQRAANK